MEGLVQRGPEGVVGGEGSVGWAGAAAGAAGGGRRLGEPREWEAEAVEVEELGLGGGEGGAGGDVVGGEEDVGWGNGGVAEAGE